MITHGSSEDALQGLTNQELLEQLTETDLRIERLQHEVRRRLQARAQTEYRLEQHTEISRIVEHLEQTTVDWHKVREFFRNSLMEAQNPWGSS